LIQRARRDGHDPREILLNKIRRVVDDDKEI